jgi:hypothetical protein
MSNGDNEEAVILDQGVLELQRAVRGHTHVETLAVMAELYYKRHHYLEGEKIWHGLIGEGGYRDNILEHSLFDQEHCAGAETLCAMGKLETKE